MVLGKAMDLSSRGHPPSSAFSQLPQIPSLAGASRE